MSGHTAISYFDQYISNNYYTLRTSAQQICWNDSSFEDVLNDNILKVRERIVKSGFTITKYNNLDRSLFSYLWMGISNDFKLKKKREGRKTVYSFDNVNIQTEVQDYYQDQNHDKELYYQQTEVVTRFLFKYLSQNYNEKQCSLFRLYYLTSSNTYNKLKEKTGYSALYIKNTITRMKKDIKDNLTNWIKNQTNYTGE